MGKLTFESDSKKMFFLIIEFAAKDDNKKKAIIAPLNSQAFDTNDLTIRSMICPSNENASRNANNATLHTNKSPPIFVIDRGVMSGTYFLIKYPT